MFYCFEVVVPNSSVTTLFLAFLLEDFHILKIHLKFKCLHSFLLRFGSKVEVVAFQVLLHK